MEERTTSIGTLLMIAKNLLFMFQVLDKCLITAYFESKAVLT